MREQVAVAACVTVLVWGGVVSAAARDARLVEAVRAGNQAAVRELVRTSALVNVPEADGTTALHWAVRMQDRDTIRLLLDAGADPQAANLYGVTPLSLAAVNGDVVAIEALLESGADPNTALPEGETALMTAARTGSVDALKALAAHGADVHAREHSLGETALMWAAAENHPRAVTLLVELGADVDARANLLEFPKYVFNGSTMVSTPLPKGGMTALLLAARENAIEGARALIDAGADLNLPDPDGTTPLIMAIVNRHNDVARLLIEAGADPDAADGSGMTALYAAVDLRELGRLINRPTPKPTSALDNLALVRMMLERGADPNARLTLPVLPRFHNAGDAQLGEGATPLMRAAKRRDLPVMRLLLDHGADPNLSTKSYATPLLFAAGLGSRGGDETEQAIEALRLCLDRGADIHAFNDAGLTALHIAVERGDDLVRFLAERGADLDLQDKAGRTPLDVALGVSAAAFEGRRRAGPGVVRESTAALLRELGATSAADAEAPR